MNTPRIEDAATVEVGKWYDVPTLFHNDWKIDVPLLGPEHEDGKIIGFPHEHWHIDWRFAPARFFKRLSYGNGWHHNPAKRIFGTVFTRLDALHENNVGGEIVRRRLKCRRPMPHYPDVDEVPWMNKLEAAYADKRLVNLVCPHKGILLAGCPVKDGMVTCPGHGLKWRLEDGKLICQTREVAP